MGELLDREDGSAGPDLPLSLSGTDLEDKNHKLSTGYTQEQTARLDFTI